MPILAHRLQLTNTQHQLRMSAEARPRAAESLSCCQSPPAAAPQLLLQPHCCCWWQSLTHVLLRYNLLLQSLQHSDQLAFKYVVRRVSPSCRLPQAAHRPAGRCTGSRSREFRWRDPVQRGSDCRLPVVEKPCFEPGSFSSLLLLLLRLTGCFLLTAAWAGTSVL